MVVLADFNWFPILSLCPASPSWMKHSSFSYFHGAKGLEPFPSSCLRKGLYMYNNTCTSPRLRTYVLILYWYKPKKINSMQLMESWLDWTFHPYLNNILYPAQLRPWLPPVAPLGSFPDQSFRAECIHAMNADLYCMLAHTVRMYMHM